MKLLLSAAGEYGGNGEPAALQKTFGATSAAGTRVFNMCGGKQLPGGVRRAAAARPLLVGQVQGFHVGLRDRATARRTRHLDARARDADANDRLQPAAAA
eukprot:1623746-Prymnesium_polylepis.1